MSGEGKRGRVSSDRSTARGRKRVRIKSERRLTLTGARKSGAVTACGLTWWWAWLWWPWWWCLVSGPPPAAACSAWTDIAARACRSRSRSRSRSTLKVQYFLRLSYYKRLYSATISYRNINRWQNSAFHFLRDSFYRAKKWKEREEKEKKANKFPRILSRSTITLRWIDLFQEKIRFLGWPSTMNSSRWIVPARILDSLRAEIGTWRTLSE